MFPWRSKRRFICRTGFVLVCLLPTTAVAAWAVFEQGDFQRQAWQARLSDELGLEARIQRVVHPAPGATRLEGVELADPETAALVARAKNLEVIESAGQVSLAIDGGEIDASQLERFWTVAAARLRPRAAIERKRTLFSAAALTLHGAQRSHLLLDVRGQSDTLTSGRQALLTFRPRHADHGEPVRICVARGSSGGRPSTSFEMRTGDKQLNCSLLLDSTPIENQLGETATFQGSIWAREAGEGWEGELAGVIREIDLHVAVTQQFPHRLGGLAEANVRKARFRRGRLEEAMGSLTAGPGIIGEPLVDAAAEILHLNRGSVPAAPDGLLGYTQLAMEYQVDASGLTMRGRCDGQAPGVVLRQRETPLLVESGGPAGPVVSLIRALVPQSDVQVPATQEAEWLMRVLPVPQVMPPSHRRASTGDRNPR